MYLTCYFSTTADKQEKERIDARNALEEYVYELRSKLSSPEELASYITEAGRDDLIKKLDDMENWLYEEGEDCKKQVYKDRFSELKTQGDPIEKRRMEYEQLPRVISEFSKILQMKQKIVESIKNKDPKYAHLTKADVDQAEQTIKYYRQYIDSCFGLIGNIQKHKDAPTKVADIEKEFSNFQSTLDPIINKPPPKVPSPPKDTQTNDAQNADQKQNNENQNQQQASQNHYANQEGTSDPHMDVD